MLTRTGALVSGLYGVLPSVELVDIAALVENR
jgi:hypothetical protein